MRVNEQLTLDFDERGEFKPHHYAFKVGDAEFDAIFDRVKAEEIPTAAARARAPTCRSIAGAADAASLDDPNGHVLEVLTA